VARPAAAVPLLVSRSSSREALAAPWGLFVAEVRHEWEQ
jgi:hypothetical protein